MYSRGNTATYHYANDAALPLFCVCFLRGIAANVIAADCRKCVRGIAAFSRHMLFFAAFSRHPLLFWMFFFAFFGANFSWRNAGTRLHNATRYVGKHVFGRTCVLLTVNLRASYFNDIYTLSTQNK